MYCLIKKSSIEKIWLFNKNIIHRKEGPAVQRENGDKEWWFYGCLNREKYFDLPAIESADGTIKRYCFDLPAIECADGTKRWYFNGRKYRLNNLPCVEYSNGTKEWYGLMSQTLHRDNNLPAVEYPNGDKEYWVNGKRHRINGPAVIIGNKQYWFVNGEFVKCIV